MYKWYMSISKLFSTPYRRRTAGFERVLASRRQNRCIGTRSASVAAIGHPFCRRLVFCASQDRRDALRRRS